MGWVSGAIQATASHINTAVQAAYNLKMTRETNEANRLMNEANNQTMLDIANDANWWQKILQDEQNTWNLQRRDEEWAYNDPSAQMQRLIQAGVNPVSGLNGVSAGQAQQLTSAPSPTPIVPSLNPSHYDTPQIDLSGLNAVGESAVNSSLATYNFLLKRAETKSNIKKVEAETALIQSQRETQDFTNKVNLETFSVIVGQKQADLMKTHQEIESLKANENLSKGQLKLVEAQEEKEYALKGQLIAATKKTESETFDKATNLYAFLTDVKSRAIQAQAAQTSAGASVMSANASLQNAITDQAQLQHLIEKDTKEFELKSNAQLLDMLKFNRGKMGDIIGSMSNPAGFLGGGLSPENLISTVLSVGKVIYNRYYSDPFSKDNYETVERYNELMKALEIPDINQYSLPQVTPSNPSVLNPIGESDKW